LAEEYGISVDQEAKIGLAVFAEEYGKYLAGMIIDGRTDG